MREQPLSREMSLRDLYHRQLAWYAYFDREVTAEANAVNCYGVLTYTEAVNRTIRAIKELHGLPLHEPRPLPWQEPGWKAPTIDPGQ